MDQQKFTLAAATVEDVIAAQRNLATAEGNVVRDRAAYAKALIQFEQATGTLLDRNHIEMSRPWRKKSTAPPISPESSDAPVGRGCVRAPSKQGRAQSELR